MFCRVLRVLVVVSIALVVLPTAVDAECVKVTPKMLRDAPSSELCSRGRSWRSPARASWGPERRSRCNECGVAKCPSDSMCICGIWPLPRPPI
jgi:hypothetical protein